MNFDQTIPSFAEASLDGNIKDLVQRVAEAEANLHAYIQSQVDAVIDPASATPILLRETQIALLESEAKFRALADTTSAAIFIVQEGCIRYANPAAMLITGYDIKELLGMQFWELAHPDFQPEIRRRWDLGESENEFPARLEIKIFTKGGDQRWIEVSFGRLVYEGKPSTIVTTFDITERMRAEGELQKAKGDLEDKVYRRTMELQVELGERRKVEQRLRQAQEALESRVLERTAQLRSANLELADTIEALRTVEDGLRSQNEELASFNKELAVARLRVESNKRRYQDLFDYAPDGYLVTDLNGVIQEANRAIVNMLQVSQKYLVGKPLVTYINSEHRPIFYHQMGKMVDYSQKVGEDKVRDRKRGYFEMELKMQPRRGGPFVAAITGLALQANEGSQPVLYWLVHDITVRVQATKALMESEARLRTVVTGAPVILWAVGRDGTVILAEGRGLQSLTPRPVQDGKRVVKNLIDERVDIQEYLNKAMAGEEVSALIEIGDSHVFDMHYVPQASPSGEVVGVIVVSTDVTSRIVAERALGQASELLERVFSSIDILIAYLDCDFNFLSVNRAYAQAGGHEPDYFIGKNHFALYPHPENLEIFTRVRETGEPHSVYEKIFVYPERPEIGETYWDWSLQPVKNAEGKIQGLVLSLVDVTDRKRAEDSIRQNAARSEILAEISRSLVEAGPSYQTIISSLVHNISTAIGDACILCLVSADGEFLNPVASFHPDPEVRKSLVDLLEESPNRVDEGVAGRVFQSGEPLLVARVDSSQLMSLVKTGYEKFAERNLITSILTVPLRTKSGRIGTLGLSRGINKPSYTQEDLRLIQSLADQASLAIVNARLYHDLETALTQEQSARSQLILAEKHAALSRMVASVAHELNNPIQTIKNCLYLTQQDSPPDSHVQEYLEMAFSETQRIARLVSQLREVYRPNWPEEMRPLDLVKVLSDVKALLEPHLQHEHVDWREHYDRDLLIVRGVLDQLKQVFLNITLNAIEAMQPEGGILTVDISVQPDRKYVVVSFQDTGSGIPEENMTRLFDPFFTTKLNGTGLGLPICDDIVRAHAGQIIVENLPGSGANFLVRLPLTSDE